MKYFRGKIHERNRHLFGLKCSNWWQLVYIFFIYLLFTPLLRLHNRLYCCLLNVRRWRRLLIRNGLLVWFLFWKSAHSHRRQWQRKQQPTNTKEWRECAELNAVKMCSKFDCQPCDIWLNLHFAEFILPMFEMLIDVLSQSESSASRAPLPGHFSKGSSLCLISHLEYFTFHGCARNNLAFEIVCDMHTSRWFSGFDHSTSVRFSDMVANKFSLYFVWQQDVASELNAIEMAVIPIIVTAIEIEIEESNCVCKTAWLA